MARGARRPLLLAAASLLPLLSGRPLRAEAMACQPTANLLAEDWEAAATALDGASAPQGVPAWAAWSRAWAPLAQGVRADLEDSLRACPEGAVTAVVHGLGALDEQEGEATSRELVKLLYHLLGSWRFPVVSGEQATSWQRHWLLAVTSLVRFVYLKWVNVPQDAKPAEPAADAAAAIIAPAAPQLRRHHALLFRHTLEEFVKSGVYELQITENSVLFSEAFAFVSFCRLHEVDLVLESGVYKGVSTEVWSHFAQVVAVDIFIPKEAEDRLVPRGGVRLVSGDGRHVLPRLLDENPGRRVAVFIDGPKGELAIRLGLDLRTHPQVAFVAMHDMAPYRTELIRRGAFFFSDESWFQEAYRHLDALYHARPDLVAGGTMAFLPGTLL